jgi:uncharacterized protein (TIGR02118 family)
MVRRGVHFHNPRKTTSPAMTGTPAHRPPRRRQTVIRISVSYPDVEGKRFDHPYYQAKHRRLLMDRLSAFGLQRVEMDKALADGAGNRPPVVAVAHLVFSDLAGFQAGMKAHGRDIMGDIANYTDLTPAILVSEMAPEAGS